MNTQPIEQRFWAKVDKMDGCWLWHGKDTGTGYGQLLVDRRWVLAHRLAYEMFIGPIPLGLTIDHLCRVRNCVNPEHLEPVTMRVNLLRGIGPSAQEARRIHCPQGHPYDLLNTRIRRSGRRSCRSCERERTRAQGMVPPGTPRPGAQGQPS